MEVLIHKIYQNGKEIFKRHRKTPIRNGVQKLQSSFCNKLLSNDASNGKSAF